ncbi:MAG: ATP-binding protein [Candidatus Ancillula sp.]|jgi:hypothetical protein|nr:ATP-binding protein [Candidatus Ancillula sp.]
MTPKYKIDLSSSFYGEAIERGLLYVDKTLFIEHVFDNPSKVTLITRPRRMGKTLNMDTLRTFLDPKVDSEQLFKGMKIEQSKYYNLQNQHPVIWLSFRTFTNEDMRGDFFSQISSCVEQYLTPEQITPELQRILDEREKSPKLLRSVRVLCANLHKVYGKRPVVLIDEYDKLYMDTAKKGGPDYDNAREFTKGIMAPALKDNPSLEKAVITGVNRIAQESMFSELNNIEVDGVFNPSIFDEDFGFTDDEVKALVPPEEFDLVQRWYDNYRVGDKEVFFTYSVVSYLKRGTFDNYWGKSGTIDLIDKALTPKRTEQIIQTIGNGGFESAVYDRISGSDLMNDFPEDESFYSLLVQTGYMTHTPIPKDEDDNDYDDDEYDDELSTPKYILNTPNRELESVWKQFILSRVVHIQNPDITDVFKHTDDLALFEFRLNDLINYKLSYYDFEKKEPEKTYHIFMLAMLVAVGFKVTSNKELGRGRYDLLMTRKTKSRGTQYFIFEFKRVDTPGKDSEFLQVAASEAIAQIREKDYAGGIEDRGDAPVYLIGIGFCGSQNWVKAEEL